MSAFLYDEALLQKLKFWTEKTNVHVYGTNETSRLFQLIADTTDDKPIELPILCLSRDGYSIQNTNKRVMTYDAMQIELNEKTSTSLNAIPINLTYQIDIYTRFMDEADAFMRNLIFNIVNYPTLTIDIPYNDAHFSANANIMISSGTVSDNSNVPERLIAGQFTRLSINISIDDAYLWDVRTRNNISIADEGMQLRIQEDDGSVIIEPIN